MPRGILAALLVSFAAASQEFKPPCQNPSYPAPPPSAALPIDAECPVSGQPNQTPAETSQNTAKDNFCAPGPAQTITVAQMSELQARAQANPKINFGGRVHPLSKHAGPTKDRNPLTKLGEGSLRVLEGYILIGRQEGKELVNCETTPPDVPASHDIHISIVGHVSQVHGNECQSVVAELSPHHRPDSWNEANVQKVALGHRRVRITGQLFFDSSHSPCVDGKAEAGDPHRASLWEIHPVYSFEVCPKHACAQGEWASLDQWVKTHP
ncbi:MAG TPA: hypothetical protein VE964_18355 [Myxococcales bacterium]|nr:hypothetical protein [Myxococcales bacterium]